MSIRVGERGIDDFEDNEVFIEGEGEQGSKGTSDKYIKRALITSIALIVVLLCALVVFTFRELNIKNIKQEVYSESKILSPNTPSIQFKSGNVLHLSTQNNMQLSSNWLTDSSLPIDIDEEQIYLVQFKENYHSTLKRSMPGTFEFSAIDLLLKNSRFIIATNNVYYLRAKKSQIRSLNTYFKWIGTMEKNWKTNIDFKSMKRGALSSVSYLQHLNSTEKLNDQFIPIQIHLLHNIETILSNLEESETEYFAKRMNSYFTNIKGLRESVDFTALTVESKDILRMKFLPHLSNIIIDKLIETAEVYWIGRYFPNKVTNYYANKLSQGSHSSNDGLSPIWDQGITGNGEVILVADTGIDWDNCFFNDPQVALPINTVNTNHRKIVSYRYNSKTDYQDYVDGHGTHVAGSIAGSILTTAASYNELKKHNGAAPNSKIYFYDTTDSKDPDSLNVPADLYQNLFTPAYISSASPKIASMSWGCNNNYVSCKYDCNCYLLKDVASLGLKAGSAVTNEQCRKEWGADCCKICNQYNTEASQVDRFLRDHEDFVILFSAGNSGATSKEGNVIAPSVAKNCISVGASSSSNEGFIASLKGEDFLKKSQELGFVDEQACCQDSSKKTYCCSTAVKAIYQNNPTVFNENNLAPFSARGPAVGDRFKPDIINVGYKIQSAHSDGDISTYQCEDISPQLGNRAATLSLLGTSMSAPITAGNVALIREYYRTKLGLTAPSGPLLKATLINSGMAIKGTVALDGNELSTRTDLSKLSYPNYYTGFGAVSLSTVLKFSNSDFQLFPYDKQTIEKTNSPKYYCFKASKNGNSNSYIRATLTWYDVANNELVEPSLLNDLDLTVNVYTNTEAVEVFRGNALSTRDNKNTVEKVNIQQIDTTNGVKMITLKVSAKALSGSQNYALVVTTSSNIVVASNSDNCTYYDPEVVPVNPVTPVTPVVNPPNDSTVIIAVVVPIGSVLILFFIVFTAALVFVCLRKPNYTEPIVHQQATELREKQSGVVMYSSKNIEAQQQFGFDGDVAYRK
ncbi:hypothetical protein ABK040_013527 [Willaertia magna]